MDYCNTSLDSFKLKILAKQAPLTAKGKLELKSKRAILNIDTGEIEEEFKKRSYKEPNLARKGISLYIGLETHNYRNFKTKQNISEDFLIILINSKLLKKRYFEGITNNNIKIIYDSIMKLDIFTTPFNTFLNSNITDVDIKTDCKVLQKELKTTLKEFDSYLDTGELTLNKRAKSLSYGYRHKSKSVISKPFIKIYSKHFELLNNSELFYDTFLKGQYKDYLRLEGTIKNNKHFQAILNHLKLDKQETTLKALLNMSEDNKINILKFMLSKYKLIKTNYLKGSEMLNAKDRFMYFTIKVFIEAGNTIKDFYNYLKEIYSSSSTYYREIKRAEKLYAILKEESNIKQKINTNEMIDFFLN